MQTNFFRKNQIHHIKKSAFHLPLLPHVLTRGSDSRPQARGRPMKAHARCPGGFWVCTEGPSRYENGGTGEIQTNKCCMIRQI